MEGRPPEAQRLEALVACGMATALAVVLHMFKLAALPQGGSVTLASALPIWVVARRYGLRWGITTGACTGLALFVMKPVVVHPLQPVFDYLLAYGALGLAALTPRPTLGAMVSTLARYAVQVSSGMLFFRHTFPQAIDPLAYSMLYNVYLIPDMAIALALLTALAARAPHLLGMPPSRETATPTRGYGMMLSGPVLMMLVGILVLGGVLLTIRSRVGDLSPVLEKLAPTAEKTNAPPSPIAR